MRRLESRVIRIRWGYSEASSFSEKLESGNRAGEKISAAANEYLSRYAILSPGPERRPVLACAILCSSCTRRCNIAAIGRGRGLLRQLSPPLMAPERSFSALTRNGSGTGTPLAQAPGPGWSARGCWYVMLIRSAMR